MFLSDTKAVAPHIIVLFGISLVMGLFLVALLGTFYGSEPEDCFTLEYTVEQLCRTSTDAKLTIDNTGVSLLRLEVTGTGTEEFTIPAQTKKTLQFSTVGVDQLAYVPAVTQGVETLQCRSKLKNARVEELRRC